MESLKKYRNRAVLALGLAFVLIESVLYPIIQTVDNRHFGIPTYLSVILAFLFSFVCYLTDRARCSALVNIALAFTLSADFCLVVLSPADELLGVSIFIGAQLAYFVYILLREENRTLRLVHIAVRTLLTLAAPVIVYTLLDGSPDALSVVSVVYYTELVLNLVFSLFDKKLRLFSVGLFLFALCDLSIGLGNLSDYFRVTGGLIGFVENTELNLAWIFYLPSQVLISLSTVRWRCVFKNI